MRADEGHGHSSSISSTKQSEVRKKRDGMAWASMMMRSDDERWHKVRQHEGRARA